MSDDDSGAGSDGPEGTETAGEVEEVAEKVAEVLGKAEEGMGERDDPGDEIVSTTADAAKATAEAAETAGEIMDAVDAAQRGDVEDAVGGTVGAIGAAGDGVGAIADGIGHAVGEGPVADVLETVSEVAGVVGGVARGIEQPLRDIVRGIAGDPADAVKYELTCAAFPEKEWVLDRVQLEEALDEPYRLDLRVAAKEGAVEVDELLGADVTLVITRRDTLSRRVCGIVQRVEESSLRRGEERQVLSLTVGPALALLALRHDTRIFQAKTAPAIVEEVLGAGLSPYGREVRCELADTYLEREYCVQYEESDLAFCERLLQEEGVAYRFEHEGDVEQLILVDRNAAFPKVETIDDRPIPYIPRADIVQERENVFSFVREQRLTSTAVAVRDFDWTQQGDMRIDADCEDDPAAERPRDVYSHHARVLTITDYDQGVAKYQRHDADRQAQIRHELHTLDRRVATGVGRAVAFHAGMTFELTGHPNGDTNGEYLITRVFHEKAPLPTAEPGEVERYHNRFECVPLEVPYRPRAIGHKPRIHSVQTAVVVGPPSEEIHTDEHGRVKVEFHWDRQGQRDEHSSCWVRVQQPWAGSGWGFVFIPRVGMEVLVSFLDGDPDRPLVIGSAYDGNNLPPYPLPDEKTKSTIKTRSTPGGEGFNELRFEDAAGSEQIYTHAQRDYDEVVLHDHTTSVGNDQTNSVDGNQTQTIGVDQTETVHGQQTMTVDRNRTVQVKGSESVVIDGGEANGGHTGAKLNVTGDYQVDASGWIEVQAPTRIKLTCGGSSILIEPGVITLTAGGQAQVVLDANALMKASSGSAVTLDANATVAASTGASATLTANADVKSSAGSQVLLDGNAKMAASGGANVQLDADAKVHGANSELVGGTTAKVGAPTATLAGGGGSVEAGGAGVTAAGGKVAVSGGMVDVTGGVVKIN